MSLVHLCWGDQLWGTRCLSLLSPLSPLSPPCLLAVNRNDRHNTRHKCTPAQTPSQDTAAGNMSIFQLVLYRTGWWCTGTGLVLSWSCMVLYGGTYYRLVMYLELLCICSCDAGTSPSAVICGYCTFRTFTVLLLLCVPDFCPLAC